MIFDKIDVRGIVSAHYATLYNNRTGARAPGDYVLFLGLPALLGWLSWRFGYALSDSGLSTLLTSLSIFVGLLFNLLVLAHALRRRGDSTPRPKRERRLLQEINANLEYSILVSLAAICVMLVSVAERTSGGTMTVGNLALVPVLSAVAIGLTAHFLLTLVMVLRRMHTLLTVEYRDLDEEAAAVPPETPRTLVPPAQETPAPLRAPLVQNPAM